MNRIQRIESLKKNILTATGDILVRSRELLIRYEAMTDAEYYEAIKSARAASVSRMAAETFAKVR